MKIVARIAQRYVLPAIAGMVSLPGPCHAGSTTPSGLALELTRLMQLDHALEIRVYEKISQHAPEQDALAVLTCVSASNDGMASRIIAGMIDQTLSASAIRDSVDFFSSPIGMSVTRYQMNLLLTNARLPSPYADSTLTHEQAEGFFRFLTGNPGVTLLASGLHATPEQMSALNIELTRMTMACVR